MRALGYFTFDPKARHGAHSYQGQYARFRDFCRDNRHTHARVFADPYGEEGLDGWRDLVNFIRDAVVGYLVVVPDARVLGAEIEQQVARVLEMDALSSRVVCSDPQYPDPLQNALRGGHAGAGRRQRIREGMMAKAAKGLGLGKPPYGYRIQADGAFRTVPEEADVVRLIFGEYLGSGGGVRSVAAVAERARARHARRGVRGVWSPCATSSATPPTSAPTGGSGSASPAPTSPSSAATTSAARRSASASAARSGRAGASPPLCSPASSSAATADAA